MLAFGEDVGRKGGVYGVTRGLPRRFGAGRVFDTLLDEQSILGLGLGAGLSGLLPVPEIQYLAYLHNAEDQLRGEAASLQFFSAGQYRNPMVARVAGLAYQKGFGGHFHNDNAVGVLRDIPGLVVAVPSRAQDAAAMLRTCLAAAAVDGTRVRFLEPIALYHTRDLYQPGDGGWLSPYLGPSGGRTCTCRWVRALPIRVPTVFVPTSPSSRSATGSRCRCGWRAGSRPTASGHGSSTCAGSLRCPRSSCSPRRSARAACLSWTRRAGPAASLRA